MSRRDQIRMTPEEVDEFLRGRRTMNIATIGKDGQPHLVAMWYGFIDGAPAFETYAKSQKVKNLQRDPRITCLVEDGDKYENLRGVELVGTAEIIEDPAVVLAVAENVVERYWGPLDDETRMMAAAMAKKRFAIKVNADKVVSWDHSKL